MIRLVSWGCSSRSVARYVTDDDLACRRRAEYKYQDGDCSDSAKCVLWS